MLGRLEKRKIRSVQEHAIEENILEEHNLKSSLEWTNDYVQRLNKQIAIFKLTNGRRENFKEKLQKQLTSNKTMKIPVAYQTWKKKDQKEN